LLGHSKVTGHGARKNTKGFWRRMADGDSGSWVKKKQSAKRKMQNYRSKFKIELILQKRIRNNFAF